MEHFFHLAPKCRCSTYKEVPQVGAYCDTWVKNVAPFCYLEGGMSASKCPGALKSKQGDFYYTKHESLCPKGKHIFS